MNKKVAYRWTLCVSSILCLCAIQIVIGGEQPINKSTVTDIQSTQSESSQGAQAVGVGMSSNKPDILKNTVNKTDQESADQDQVIPQEMSEEVADITQPESMSPEKMSVVFPDTLTVTRQDSQDTARAQSGVSVDELFDEDAKRKAAVTLVDRGVEYFNKHSLADICHVFSHTKNFIEGELYLFVYSADGSVFAHGQQSDLLWKNLHNLHDSFGTPIVQSIIKKAQEGGGWVIYKWRNATKVSYVKEVKKDGKSYIVGTGYYPHSKPDAAVNLVKGAVGFFNKTIKEGRRVDDAFSPLSYPIGRFIQGDLYLYALDFKGNNVANGKQPSLIGTNSWNYKDSAGVLVNQEIVKRLKTSEGGIWIEYMSGGAPKRSYVEKIKDAQGNDYFIGCGYYPDATRKRVVDLVRKGYHFMKTHGLSESERAFRDPGSSEYRYGDLSLFVYDLKGKVIVHGTNTELIGQNHLDHKDDDGRLYVRDMIQEARYGGGGWIDVKMKNSFKSIYVEKVDLGMKSFVIGSGIYPISKHESMELLAKSGADYLETHELQEACADFVNKEGQFVRGDLNLFVFDTNGICYVYGDDMSVIWRPLLDATDDNGILFVQEMINAAKYGASEVRYTLNGVEKIGYVKMVQKKDTVFIVGSSYFR